MHSRALASRSQNVLANFRNSKNNNSQLLLASLKLDNQIPRSPQLELDLARLSHTPIRRIRYLPELDMEIEIVESPRKSIVNKSLRVGALREHRDENSKEIHPIRPHTSRPRPLSPPRFDLSNYDMNTVTDEPVSFYLPIHIHACVPLSILSTLRFEVSKLRT